MHTTIYFGALLLQNVCIWAAAACGYGPVLAASMVFAIRVVAAPIVIFFVIRQTTWLRFGVAKANIASLRKLMRPALGNISLSLGHAVSLQGYVLAIAATLGPVAVVTFSTLRTLARVTTQFVLALNHSIEPQLAVAYGRSDSLLQRRLYEHMLRASLWIGLGAASFLAIGGEFVLEQWTHGRVSMDPVLFSLLLGSAVLGGVWYAGVIGLKAVNQHLSVSLVYACSACAALGVAFLALDMARSVRIAAAGLVIIDLGMLYAVIHVAARTFGVRAEKQLRTVIDLKPFVKAVRVFSKSRVN
jgi:O-antigen/teichoic acid export membrane protein